MSKVAKSVESVAPTFGQMVRYWVKNGFENRSIPAVVCGAQEDKNGLWWAELRPQIAPSMVSNFRDTDLNFESVPYGRPGQPGSWTFIDEDVPGPGPRGEA